MGELNQESFIKALPAIVLCSVHSACLPVPSVLALKSARLFGIRTASIRGLARFSIKFVLLYGFLFSYLKDIHVRICLLFL